MQDASLGWSSDRKIVDLDGESKMTKEEKWEEKWRNWHIKQPQVGHPELVSLNSYLQACRDMEEERQEEIERLKKIIVKLLSGDLLQECIDELEKEAK